MMDVKLTQCFDQVMVAVHLACRGRDIFAISAPCMLHFLLLQAPLMLVALFEQSQMSHAMGYYRTACIGVDVKVLSQACGFEHHWLWYLWCSLPGVHAFIQLASLLGADVQLFGKVPGLYGSHILVSPSHFDPELHSHILIKIGV